MTTITRFPPEPNGYLHIGHAQAMFLDFNSNCTILRFDDTNPTVEKQEYIDNIIENVEWLGYKPTRITYTSDYFDKMYELCIELIKRDKAYVCHLSREEASQGRERMEDSPWRNRPISESLKWLEDMRKGKVEEGKAVVRMKMDMKNPNTAMRDLVAYRVKFSAHPRTGNKWCIYPSYDFAHCIVDSLENITHSYCTLEFLPRRESYYWLLKALDLYCPTVWEFARLNISHNILSKRRLRVLIEEKYVRGWDDPRLLTLNGMRRRGFNPRSIRMLCEQVGITRHNSITSYALLEHCIRTDLNVVAPRRFAVINPLLITLTNVKESFTIEVPNFPNDKSSSTRTLTLASSVWISRSDFRLIDDKKYYGLAPGKSANLRYVGCITVNRVLFKEPEEVIKLECSLSNINPKLKGHLHWVSENSVPVEFRLYEPLFKSSEPGEDYLSDINPESETIAHGLAEPSIAKLPIDTSIQCERVGYFTIDQDSRNDSIVLNRTVELRESKLAKEIKIKK